ncbi:hypothetical protein GBAR_LOCUS29601, partial [Geodia barretti]
QYLGGLCVCYSPRTSVRPRNDTIYPTGDEGDVMPPTLLYSPSTIIAPHPIMTSGSNNAVVATVVTNSTVVSNGRADRNISTPVIITMASLLFLLILANLGALVVCLTKRKKNIMEGSNSTTAPSSTHNDEEILSTNEAYISRGITVRDNPAYWEPQGRPREMRRSLSWSGSYAYVRRFS